MKEIDARNHLQLNVTHVGGDTGYCAFSCMYDRNDLSEKSNFGRDQVKGRRAKL